MGIPLEEQSRIFQRFFRSSLASQYAIQGTGLGLNIVRAIAEAHQGRVDFESQPGVGTTFRFVVPLLDPVPVRPVAPAPRGGAHAAVLRSERAVESNRQR